MPCFNIMFAHTLVLLFIFFSFLRVVFLVHCLCIPRVNVLFFLLRWKRIVFLLNWLELYAIFTLSYLFFAGCPLLLHCMCEVFCDLFVLFFIYFFLLSVQIKKSLYQVVWLMRAHLFTLLNGNIQRKLVSLFFAHSTRILHCTILIAIVLKVGLLVTVHLCLQTRPFLSFFWFKI